MVHAGREKEEVFSLGVFGKETLHVFDLEGDPGETRNLADQMPPEAAELLKILRTFVAESHS